MPILSIVIPVYNEVRTLASVVDAVASSGLEDYQLIVVDDWSTDGTRALLGGELGNRIDAVVLHERNRGKGAAIRTGIAAATGDFVVFQDADLEYEPRDMARMLKVIQGGAADVIYGSRFLDTAASGRSPLWHRSINRFLTSYSNLHTGLKLTDMETCYKMFPRSLLERITIEEDRFGVEPEITAKIAALGASFLEIPISYNRRTFEEGKKIGMRDGFRAIYAITKYAFRS